MSNFYLQTLEGVARFGEVSPDRKEEVRKAFDYYYKYHGDVVDPVEHFYKTFMSLTLAYTDEEIKTLYDRSDLKPEAREAANYFEIQRGRERAAQKAAQDASAAAEARRAYEAREAAEAEAEAARAALDEQRRLAAQQASAVEEAEEIINEGNSMAQNIPAQEETDVNISTQLVTSGQEYTVVDETAETIAYVDEAGELHVEQKQKSGLGWLVAAAAAFFLLT